MSSYSEPARNSPGKTATGSPCDASIGTHFIPLSLDVQNPSRIDHVLVYAPMGFGPLAEGGLRISERRG